MPKYCRSKSNYPNARAAWRDIHRRTGIEPSQVSHTEHTSRRWCWVVPNP